MNICILTPRFPMPENGGDVLRINNIARYLKQNGHTVYLISYCDTIPNEDCIKMVKQVYDEVIFIQRRKLKSLLYSLLFFIRGKPIQCGYYYSRKYLNVLKQFIREYKPELFISHLIRMTTYLTKLHLESMSIVEMTDALSKTYSLSSVCSGFSLKKIIYRFERSLTQKYEQYIIKRFPKVILVSKADIEYLGNHSNTMFYTNGINCIENNNNYNLNKICFVGNMRTLQNQNAVLRFYNDILPIIKQKVKTVQFHIIGAQPSVLIKNLHNGIDVFVTGFVDSVEQYISDMNSIVEAIHKELDNL